ncbi:aminotransferase class III-fold pyridoxal phosphate-dependent enzyme [Nostoc sp. FACHB-190]|uniref:aminotransferase class III-fold pyridoxal phosphate-dependent enzyme n=1 Tax=Nostoc sp. FACHB-190 TaxID=2692838 RepID=UPI0016846B2E|nr:aminotransferase class III-fold pyridoxal phosphate-dependent enzyme [Nostoc sp. FACHB-190]MBD2303674.1 aminotransferase class III-fold pyridoxal phosphate-dependent enzyme [Nostoc sp. FACHB-190]
MKKDIQSSLKPSYPHLTSLGGSWYSSDAGVRLLDLSAQTLNLPTGQPDSNLVHKLTQQIQNLVFASSRFGSDPFDQLATQLLNLSPEFIESVNHKLCDGSDAVETALKLGRLYTRNVNVLALPKAWHGETIDTLRLCSAFRSRYLVSGNNVTYSEQSSLDSLIELAFVTSRPSTIILDPIGVSTGLFPDQNIGVKLKELWEVCCQRGHFLIFDEVQTFGGFLGSELFTYGLYGAKCHAIVVGKALGQGFPIAACLYTGGLNKLLKYNEAEFTHGGQPPACIAALHGIEYFVSNKEKIRDSLNLFRENFVNYIITNYSQHFEIRNIGFFCSLIPKSKLKKIIINDLYVKLYKNSIICRKADFGSALLIKSPINIDDSMISYAIDKFDHILPSFNENLIQRVVGTQMPDAQISEKDIPIISIYKKNKKNERKSILNYIENLLFYFGSITVVQRSAQEQVEVSNRLAEIGIPVPDSFTDKDLFFSSQIPGITADIALSGTGIDIDTDIVEAIFSQITDYTIKAHSYGIIIGDRWAKNSIWNCSEVFFIDFDIGYLGHSSKTQPFERFFCFFHHLIYVSNQALRKHLILSYGREFLEDFGDSALGTFLCFQRFYSSPFKPVNSNSFSWDIYKNCIEDIIDVLGISKYF